MLTFVATHICLVMEINRTLMQYMFSYS